MLEVLTRWTGDRSRAVLGSITCTTSSGDRDALKAPWSAARLACGAGVLGVVAFGENVLGSHQHDHGLLFAADDGVVGRFSRTWEQTVGGSGHAFRFTELTGWARFVRTSELRADGASRGLDTDVANVVRYATKDVAEVRASALLGLFERVLENENATTVVLCACGCLTPIHRATTGRPAKFLNTAHKKRWHRAQRKAATP